MPLFACPTKVLIASLRGALGLERTSAGLVPVRLLDSVWHSTPDWFGRDAFRMPTGVRLALTTKATMLELDVVATRLSVEGFEDVPVPPLAVDLFVDGEEHGERRIERTRQRLVSLDGELLADSEPAPVTLRFTGLADAEKSLELWLPTSATVELRALRANAPVYASEEARPRWIHYGSSISQGADVPRPSRTWAAVAARLARVDLHNLAVAGGCHLYQFVARSIRDTPTACISLKVGINIAVGDTLKYRTFVSAVHGFLDTVRDRHPETPILLVSPIICPILEESPGPVLPADGALGARLDSWEGKHALSLRRMRDILEEVVEVRSVDDPYLYYLNGLRLFGERDLAELPDGIHPSPVGHVRIGERFAELAFGKDGCFAGAGFGSPVAT